MKKRRRSRLEGRHFLGQRRRLHPLPGGASRSGRGSPGPPEHRRAGGPWGSLGVPSPRRARLGRSGGGGTMQESYESLILLDFPIPKPNIVSRLEPEEELGVPDPNDSKEWEILRVAPADDSAPPSEEEEPEDGPEPAPPPTLDSLLLLPSPSPPPPLPPPSPPLPPAGRGSRRGRGRRGCGRSQPAPPPHKPFTCLACGKGFTRSSNRNAHLATHLGQRPHTCGHCGRGFGHAPQLARHLRLHQVSQRRFGCGQCGRSFGRSANLSAHLRAHLGERPYTCTECGRGFSYSSAFLKHRRAHGQQQEEEEGRKRRRKKGTPGLTCAPGHTCAPGRGCQRRGAGFAEGHALLAHLHGHAADTPLACATPDVCATPLTCATPYTCGDCGKGFGGSSALIRHQRLHLG